MDIAVSPSAKIFAIHKEILEQRALIGRQQNELTRQQSFLDAQLLRIVAMEGEVDVLKAAIY